MYPPPPPPAHTLLYKCASYQEHVLLIQAGGSLSIPLEILVAPHPPPHFTAQNAGDEVIIYETRDAPEKRNLYTTNGQGWGWWGLWSSGLRVLCGGAEIMKCSRTWQFPKIGGPKYTPPSTKILIVGTSKGASQF